MWDHSIAEVPLADNSDEEQKDSDRSRSREYPHKQRIRNLKRLIAEGKVKPSSETVIFFLCNKFAISEERQTKLS
ncbi:jg10048 [Pararge aegeria aegeria]|uniref:Jg10048 protein n=2 Tax=Pararge aegeria TaxID=116150 RepID=A0A8S4S7I8_9NEOP|nr:jg10048 [Pararge aegeria aegeria]